VATQGPFTPSILSTDGSGIVAWNNVNDATICGGLGFAFATYGALQFGVSDYMLGTGFPFVIPIGSTINGITMSIDRLESGPDVFDTSILIIQGGVAGGVDHATFVNWPLVEATMTVGGGADLWGLAWTPAQINAVDFGVQIAIEKNAGGAVGGFVNCFTLTVDFTPPTAASRRGWLLRGCD